MDTRRAVTLLRERLDELQLFEHGRREGWLEWQKRTIATISNVFPQGHRAHNDFTTLRRSPMVSPSSEESKWNAFNRGKTGAAAILNAAIYELQELVDGPEDQTSPILAVHELKALERVVGELRRAEEAGELDQVDPEDRAEISAEVETLQAQLRSPKPKRAIVREALRSLRVITEQAAGSAIGAGVVVAVSMAADLIG